MADETGEGPRGGTATTRQPGEAPLASQPAGFDPAGEARRLLRTVRAGALATLDAAGGHPLATLVTVATDIDGTPLLLLSGLSAHTRNIAADPRVSLLLAEGGKGDPLAHPRLSLLGTAHPVGTDEARAGRIRVRFLARHPKAALYADFPDFAFFALAVEGGHLNGGFARAARLSTEELILDLAGAYALAAAEEGALAHMNADHADAIRLYATALLGRRDGPWRLTGLDPEGADLMKGEETARLRFPAPVTDAGALRAALVSLAAAARAKAAG